MGTSKCTIHNLHTYKSFLLFIFLGIELEKSLGLALVTLIGVANSNVAVLRIGSVLEASQLDRWISVAWNSGAIYQNANASSTSQ